MKSILLLSATLLAPLAAWAADDIKPFDGKPGLWETTSTMEMSGMPGMPAGMPQIPPEQLAKMTPQQRAQVEAILKSRMDAARGAPQTNTTKVCMTADSFKNALDMSQRENCTSKVTASSSSSQTIHMECTQGKTNMSGDMMVERVDAEHAKGNMVMKTSGEATMNIKMSFTTKWLSADCGDVKPLGRK